MSDLIDRNAVLFLVRVQGIDLAGRAIEFTAKRFEAPEDYVVVIIDRRFQGG
jgi:hypothetical protein